MWRLDARPDYSRWSTDVRMEAGVRAALEQIHSFMHPQLYIVEENPPEEAFLSRGVRSQALENGKPVIQLPRKAVTNLMWLTRLSVGSLSGKLHEIGLSSTSLILTVTSMAKYLHRYPHSGAGPVVGILDEAPQFHRGCRLFRV